MSYKYLVKLKPIDTFFFGGDITFGELGDKENGSYIVKSRIFPQQSAVLGMIRREMMIQQGLLTRKRRGEWVDSQNVKEAKALVGDAQFSINTKEQDYGIINSISPIFITKDNENFIVKNNCGIFNKSEGKSYIDEEMKDFIPILDNFDVKKGIKRLLVSQNRSLKIDKIFKPIERVGNQKEEQDDALFKITSYQFLCQFEFAFILELNREYSFDDSVVLLGGNNSYFRLTSKPMENTFDKIFSFLKPKDNTVLLLSDSYLGENVLNYCDFAVSSTISFRNIHSKIKKQKGEFVKNDKIDLYERGSYFFNPTDKLIELLENSHLQKIGMNKYLQGDSCEK